MLNTLCTAGRVARLGWYFTGIIDYRKIIMVRKKQSRKKCLTIPEDLGSQWKTLKRRDLQKKDPSPEVVSP